MKIGKLRIKGFKIKVLFWNHPALVVLFTGFLKRLGTQLSPAGKVASSVAEVKSGWHCNAYVMLSKTVL